MTKPAPIRTDSTDAAQYQALHFLELARRFTPSNLFDANPYRAALFSAAVACVSLRVTQWWSTRVLPFEELFATVEDIAGEGTVHSPEDAATLFLLVREAMA